MFTVHFAKFCKNDVRSTIGFKAPYESSPKKLVKFNMQHMTSRSVL